MKILLEQRRHVMLELHMSDQQLYCLLKRDLYWMFADNYDISLIRPRAAIFSNDQIILQQ